MDWDFPTTRGKLSRYDSCMTKCSLDQPPSSVLPVLGFGAAGIKAGTLAAGVQSALYGAAVPAGGWFATATSWGATGAMATPMGFAGAVVGGAAYLLYSRS